MDIFLDILLDSFLDTLKLFPFLFFIYFLIELLEFKNVFKFGHSKLLTGKASPVIGALFGIVPQCGFSVISSELYSKKKMSISALIAVFLATSDEAFPILVSNYKSIPVLLVLLLSKLIIALLVGYLTFFIYEHLILRRRQKMQNIGSNAEKEAKNHEITAEIAENNSKIDSHDEHNDHIEGDHDEDHEDSHDEFHHSHLHACCHHDIEENQKFDWKHPLVHSLKISLYILIVNIILSGVIALIGEEKLADFLTASYVFQPLFALIIGLIPNCASSVILTELYMQGMISFGAILTGLCAGAGIGMVVLFKENKNLKQNFLIISIIAVTSLIFGYAVHFIPFNII